jgi:hypothetical protein
VVLLSSVVCPSSALHLYPSEYIGLGVDLCQGGRYPQPDDGFPKLGDDGIEIA